jgi:hypothetical protein
MIELDRAQFQQWLESKDPQCVIGDVGHVAEADRNPLAIFLRCATRRRYRVSLDEYQLYFEVQVLPDWAREFALRIDNMGLFEPFDADVPYRRITAQEALRVLTCLPTP